jgi:hypothetical protein
LKNLSSYQSTKGNNPFEDFTMNGDPSKRLSSIVQCYDPPYWDSKEAYAYIKANFESWIEEAIPSGKNSRKVGGYGCIVVNK